MVLPLNPLIIKRSRVSVETIKRSRVSLETIKRSRASKRSDQAIKGLETERSSDQGRFSPIKILDPGRKRFYRRRVCDYTPCDVVCIVETLLDGKICDQELRVMNKTHAQDNHPAVFRNL